MKHTQEERQQFLYDAIDHLADVVPNGQLLSCTVPTELLHEAARIIEKYNDPKKEISYEIRLKNGPRLMEAITTAKEAKEIAQGFRNIKHGKVINIFKVTKEMIE